MDFRDYLRILQRRWLVVAGVTVLIVAAGFYFVWQEPTVYTAKAEVIVRENPYYFQAGEFQPLFPDYFSRAARATIIRTRAVLEYAVLHGLEKYYPKAKDDPAALNDAVNHLRGTIQVAQEKDVEIITISYSSLDETRAVETANALAEAFEEISRRRQQEGIAKTIEYIKSVKKEREDAKKALEAELKKLGPPPAESLLGREEKALLDEIAVLHKRRQDLELQILDARSEIDRLSAQLQQPDEIPVTSRPVESKAKVLYDQIAAKQDELRTLRRKYADHAPAVTAMLEEIEWLEAKYSEALDREAKTSQFEAQQGVIDQIRRTQQERRKLETQLAQNGDAQADARERYRIITEKPVDPLIEQELKKAERRNELAAQIKSYEESIAGLEKTKDTLEINSKKIVSAAERLDKAVRGSPTEKRGSKTLPLVAITGLILGIAAAFLLEYMNTSIRTEHDVKRYVNLPLLGAILKIRNEQERLLLHVAPKTPLAEVFNTIASMLETHAKDTGAKVFMIASSNAGEGKSTVTSNIGIALARGGKRVILVDADLRKAVLHRFFSVQPSKGLANYLLAQTGSLAEGEPAAALDEIIQPSGVENLSVVPAGLHPKDPGNLLKSEAFQTLLQELRQRADVVLVDVPPVRIAVDTLVLAPLVDSIVLLVSAGETNKDDVAFGKRLLEMAKGKMVGCILNKVTLQSRGYYYYYYHYYDAYKYYRDR